MNHGIVVIINRRRNILITGSMHGITKQMFVTRINRMEIRALDVFYVGSSTVAVPCYYYLRSLLVLLDSACCSDSKLVSGSLCVTWGTTS